MTRLERIVRIKEMHHTDLMRLVTVAGSNGEVIAYLAEENQY